MWLDIPLLIGHPESLGQVIFFYSGCELVGVPVLGLGALYL